MTDPESSRPVTPGAWLTERVTMRLPRRALVGAAAAALLLRVVALD